MSASDDYKIRRENLAWLRRTKYKTNTALAEAIGRQADYVSRMLSEGENQKRIGERLAREMEPLLGLPEKSLDSPLWERDRERDRDRDESLPAGIIDAALLAEAIERVELEYPHWTVRERAEFIAEVYLFAVEPPTGPAGAPPLNRIFNLMRRVK